VLRHLRAWLSLDDTPDSITRARVIAFLEDLRERKRRPVTVHSYAVIIHTFLRWCVDSELLHADPLQGFTVKTPKQLPRVPTVDEVRCLLRACDTGTLENLRNKAMLLLFIDSGLRLSEALRLRVEDLQFATRTIGVRQGKGGKDRTAFFGPVTAQALRSYVTRRRAGQEDFLFAYRDGRPMTRRHVLQICYRLSQRAGLGWKVHPHALRHFCGVSILKQTGNLEVVRQVLGHETLHMALHYSRLASPDVARAYRRASPVDSLTLE
jgi:site-specific recombinase XerD